MKRNKPIGYTLVEILIGVFIMSVGMVSILGVFPIGVMIVQKIKVTTVLCNFASMKVAEFQAYYSPMETLSHGEDYQTRNQFHTITADRIHSPAGWERDSGFIARSPNGRPTEEQLKIRGAGRNCHWKIADYELYEDKGLYDHEISYERFGNPSSAGETSFMYGAGNYNSMVFCRAYRMGMTQNQRRPYSGYAFVRKYVIEVWEGGDKTKTDDGFTPGVDELKAYYAYITGIWNPHVFHSAEWTPVMQTTTYADREFASQTLDWFWPWNNPHDLEGWGHLRNGDTGSDSRFSAPGTGTTGAGNWPWG